MLLTSGNLDDPNMKRKSKWREGSHPDSRKDKLDKLYNRIETEMSVIEDGGSNAAAGKDGEKDGQVLFDEATSGRDVAPVDQSGAQAGSEGTTLVVAGAVNDSENAPLATIPYPRGVNGAALVLRNQATAEELQVPSVPPEGKMNLSSWKTSIPESTVDEIDLLFHTDEEVKQKEAVFNRLNKEYLEQQKRKEKERKNADAASKELQDEEAIQLEGKSRYASQKAKKRRMGSRRGEGDVDDANMVPTTEEALLAALSTRKISKKINYDAMSAIFDEDGSFSTDMLEDKVGPGPGGRYEGQPDAVF